MNEKTLIPIKELLELTTLKDVRSLRNIFPTVTIKDDEYVLEEEVLKVFNIDSITEPFISLNEASEIFKISKSTLTLMIKRNAVPWYQLKNSRGSKFLFRKSELEKALRVFILRNGAGTYTKYEQLIKLAMDFINSNRIKNSIDENHYKMLYSYLFLNNTYEQIGVIYNLSRERVRQIIEKQFKRIAARMNNINSYLNNSIEERLKREIMTLRSIVRTCKETFGDIKNIKKEPIDDVDILYTKLVDLDLSVRVLNCTKSANIEIIGDLIEHTENDMLRHRNMGKKSLTELRELLYSYGLQFKK